MVDKGDNLGVHLPSLIHTRLLRLTTPAQVSTISDEELRTCAKADFLFLGLCASVSGLARGEVDLDETVMTGGSGLFMGNCGD